MKIKTSELSGKALDYAVAKCEGVGVRWSAPHEQLIRDGCSYMVWCPSRDWSIAGPIIEREWLDLTPWPNESREDMRWHCQQYDSSGDCGQYGPTLLIAAMRCCVASKLGDEVEIPDVLRCTDSRAL